VVPPSLPTVTPPQLYWEDGDGIGRANLDGTAITPHLIPVGVQATCGGGTVAADRNYVYWTIPDPAALADRRPGNTWGEVARARRDGTGVDQSFITTTSPYVPLCVAVDGAHVYWTSVVLSGGVGPKIVIGRANLDGTDVQESFISGISASCLVADGAHIYWDSGGGIGRANVDGTGITDFISIDFIGGFARCGLVVDGGHIYFESNKGIGRANLDGTGVNESFISGPGVSESQPCADDGTYLYWINGLSGPGASTSSIGPIGRARLDGTGGVQEDFIPGVFSSSGCAIGP